MKYNPPEIVIKLLFLAMMTFLISNILCSCTQEKEIQSTISTGRVIKVEQGSYRCTIKVRDFNDSVLYSDYFVPLSYFPMFIVGQPIWIIVKR